MLIVRFVAFCILRSEDLDKVSFLAADRAYSKILATLKAADLVPARGNDAVDWILVANNALFKKINKRVKFECEWYHDGR